MNYYTCTCQPHTPLCGSCWPSQWVSSPPVSPKALCLAHMKAETSSEGCLLHISTACRSQCVAGFEWEGDRCRILVMVLRENVFHVSDIMDDNSFDQAGWKIAFLRLASAAALLGDNGWYCSIQSLFSLKLSLFGEEEKKNLSVPRYFVFKPPTWMIWTCQEDSSIQI